MDVMINGEVHALDADTTVAAVIDRLANRDARGIAVAVNAEVVPRSAWSDHVLGAGDRVEVLGATQGG